MRCVNIDWLEVYCEESNDRYPCNADYYRRQGYFVKERDYGTRVYAEMFFIQDTSGNDIIEVRRNPKSGESDFKGLSQFSTHIRLCNWLCYQDNCIDILRDFLLRNDYIFHRIFRLDICYDFERFDSGDKPAKVAKRIIEKVYLKMNQGRIAVHGADKWASFEWESLSWGSPSSMVTTKMYNKTKELAAGGNKKPYIYSNWMQCDLITNPLSLVKRDTDGNEYKPEIWRIEFSIRSKADSWLILNNVSEKRSEGQRVKHSLSMFDAKDKLWQRFQDLAHHYFRFKIRTFKKPKRGITENALSRIQTKEEPELQRKDRMPDKVLFTFNENREYLHVQAVPKPSKPDTREMRLRNALIWYSDTHPMPKIRQACQAILETIDVRDLYRYTSNYDIAEVKAMQTAIQLKMGGDTRQTAQIIDELIELFKKQEIW